MNRKIMAITLAVAFGAPLSANALSDRDFKNQKKRIDAQHRADQQKCSAFAENAKDICLAQANGTEKVAKAELQSRREKNTPEARHDLRLAKAEATHDIAKEKCDDMSGNAKDVCIKDALAAFTRAKAEARVDRKAGETAGGPLDNKADNVARSADYDAAVERCDDASPGETKARCVTDTKARFGMK